MSSAISPLAHRTTLTVRQGQDVLRDVRRITADWLNRKFCRAVPIASGLHHLDDLRVLSSQVAYDPDGSESAMRLQLREDAAEATWRTTVTAVVPPPGEAAVVSVALECFPNPGHKPVPQRPGLVTALVGNLDCTDGLAPLTLSPVPVGPAEVGHLIDVLCDPDRRLPVVVAARPLHEEPLWLDRMASAMRKSAGAASLYLLDGVGAVDAFRVQAEHHRVAPGAVRVFLTGVDPAWAPDGPRHRYSTVARLSDPKSGSWDHLVRIVQRMSTEAALPPALHALAFPDEDQRRRDERRAALDTARHGDEMEALLRKVGELTELLDLADGEIEEHRRSAELAALTHSSLDAELREVREKWDTDLEEQLQVLEEIDRARAEADELRRRLAREGRVDETVVVDPLPGQPASFEDLWGRRDAFEHVLVSADAGPALALDETDRARVWAAKTWAALRALDRYGRDAGEGFNGGFYEHCQSDRSLWPVKKVSMVETDQTMAKYGTERLLPVPRSYDPVGKAEMQPHLKIDSKGSTSPRIHFLDDTKGPTGKVIVGYIGEHLTNMKTN
ncbi:hypothetical protein OOK31_10255 [Streptomyces sp. NBC_00249]|uniref:hypothetical protein n=1 Tax=Streptomyces sp. NBC_00249 TaxID=2975690 RepID=UPI002251027B|nr:hypothetical protein [Streptomyces sp. NBC_00249]MCX5194274.1 hypothetical protein [Streptomyces sp. NBC_00249]